MSVNKSNQKINSLLNDGPQTPQELPGSNSINVEARRDGVLKFNPRASGQHGSKETGGGRKTPVYFVKGKHEPEVVVRKWLEVNRSASREVSHLSLHHRIASYGEDWRKASYELLDFDPPNPDGGDHDMGGTCPLCGVEYEYNLPEHLPCESDEVTGP